MSRERILEAMNGARAVTVPVKPALPVVLYYVTAVAMRDASVHFAEDVYAHDARLEGALAALTGAQSSLK